MEEKEAFIYEAETRYKYDVNENQLTSRVFGALAMLPRDIVLLPFLKKLAKDTRPPSEKDVVFAEIEKSNFKAVESAKITLWKRIDEKRPDVCITTPANLILIEAKTDSDPDKDEQLKPQFIEGYKEATQTGRKFAYFLLTRDDQSPVARDTEKKLEKKLQDAKVRVHWRSWTQVWQWLREIRKDLQGKNGIENTSLKLLDATIKLLEARHMNIKGPTGFEEKWFGNNVIKALDEVEELCSEISTTMKKVIVNAEAKGIRVMRDKPPVTFKLSDTRDSTKRYSDFPFKDKGWTKVEDPDKDPHLYVYFGLEADSQGICVGFWWPRPPKEEIENAKRKANEIKRTLGKKKLFIEREEHDELNIGYDIGSEQVEKDERAIRTFVEMLDEMREFANKFANEFETLRKTLGIKSPRISRKKPR